MNRDDFIIHVYCLVCEHYDLLLRELPHGVRRGGFAPALSDCEAITIEVCGELMKMNDDVDLFTYFKTHYQAWFPHLRERSLFVRQCAGLWQVKAHIQRSLVACSGWADDPVQSVDTLPLPVCHKARRFVERCFQGQADDGYCSSKKEFYYGFKLGLRIARCGLITHYELLSARPHDVNSLETLVEGLNAPPGGTILVPADKGFVDARRAALLKQRRGITLVTNPRQGAKRKMKAEHPKPLLQACAHWRKLIETVNAHLTGRFDIARIRVRDLWHLQHRIIRKILAHTIAVCLNLMLGRKPLDISGLVNG